MSISMQAILPPNQKKFDTAALRKALARAIDQTANTMKGDFENTTRTWSNRPEFYTVPGHEAGGGMEGAVGTDDPIFGYVTRGTKPHQIRPKNARVLMWEGGKYASKTTPGTLGSRSGGLAPTGGVGKPIVAKLVNHPGTKPRLFEQEIAKRRGDTFSAAIQNVMAGLAKGG